MRNEIRKPIQLTTVISLTTDVGFGLLALCDDGTMWIKLQAGWERIADIPQTYAEGEEKATKTQPPASLYTFRESFPPKAVKSP